MSFTSLIIYPTKSPHTLNMIGDISHVSMVVRQETSLGGHHLVALLSSGELTFCHGKWPFIDIYSGFSH